MDDVFRDDDDGALYHAYDGDDAYGQHLGAHHAHVYHHDVCDATSRDVRVFLCHPRVSPRVPLHASVSSYLWSVSHPSHLHDDASVFWYQILCSNAMTSHVRHPYHDASSPYHHGASSHCQCDDDDPFPSDVHANRGDVCPHAVCPNDVLLCGDHSCDPYDASNGDDVMSHLHA